ncbi:hypothetical protein T310_3676 [Rasamsonia emersonii CBS 393.64]|uniref:DUF7624 domain-containing protein n=1 Tax=Rasamsonia emersonii (strain ATCC 16479 / CBS 393.64 / IMI 116815) TaxID=1408163 RepID=A0A0F4YVM4_RASE3|nr:hypothetical protein T310_3676 [Rasamsonia emersonii CBS 393.64]KKA22284.1 hypothetical protein T310_3676 [Rasamsonia emersonii CBS 393.64]
MIAVRPACSVSPSSLGSSLSQYSKSIKLSTSSNSVQYPTMSIDNNSYGATPQPTAVNEELKSMSEPSSDALPLVANRETNLRNTASNDMKSNVNSKPGGTGQGIANTVQPELTIRTSDTLFANFEARPDDDDPPQSVIHAPPAFGDFKTNKDQMNAVSNNADGFSSVESDMIAEPSRANEAQRKSFNSPVSPPPLTTTIPPAKDWSERATPRAQTRPEIEDLDRPPRSSNLEDIPESADVVTAVEEVYEAPDKRVLVSENLQDNGDEINALRTALAECWTLCNTLANLSYIHRERLFNFSEKGDMQELAWNSCWKLCQKLYDSQDDDYPSHVTPTLDLCRDFCQALFEVRVRDNEIADSVLRVSFELNNHLYNTHDRNLPEAFRERTLDFYITLCHRLMKQRMHLAEETESLLHACWSLAEMLFSLRQRRHQSKRPDEELLGSAIQACWELCDLFREGWTQIRPDRGTPRPSQTAFSQTCYQTKQTEGAVVDDSIGQQGNPETPTTIFEDTATASPDEAPTPNILVLEHGQTQTTPAKWSSNSSTLSGRSRSSEQSSSTNTITTPSGHPNLMPLKLLVAKAAMNSGYQRDSSQNLASFAKSLSSDSFGSLPWQVTLLENYKNLVVSDPAFRVISPPARASALEIARAVQAMTQSGQYTWLRDLYRLVFGFHPEEAMSRRNVTIQT